MARQISRRRFMQGSAASALGLWLAQDKSPNSRLNIALIGVGGRGSWFVGVIPRMGQNVVAICDVNESKAEEAYRKFPDVPKFHDYRKMFDEMEKTIDAVIIAAPDHIHGPATAAAIKRGKHVYCEKPLTQNVLEARTVRRLAREHKVATQMGNQGTASHDFRRALEIFRSGALGEIKEVHVWNSGGGSSHRQPPQGQNPIPDYLKWDLWLGPAAERPFHRDWMNWHMWREFGTGNIGNWASHTTNLAFMGLDLAKLWHGEAGPTFKIEAKVSEINKLSFPRWEDIRWDMPGATIYWHNGFGPGAREKIEELLGGRISGNEGQFKNVNFAGLLFVGSKAMLLSTGHNATFQLLPEIDVKSIPQSVPRSPGHENEWIQACKGGKPAWSNFDYSGPLAEFLLLGNVATQFEGALEYDPVAGKIVNNAAADRALGREYRKGWEL